MKLTDQVDSWKNKKVLIIGEALIDKYIIGYADRISPDAPVPSIKIEEDLSYLGAIGLVFKFVKSLGGEPEVCSIIGEDYEGELFLSGSKKNGIDTSGILVDPSMMTPKITRIKSMNQHLLRLESDYNNKPSDDVISKFYEIILNRSKDIDSILILDYGIGDIFEDSFIQKLLTDLKDVYEAPIIARPNFENYYLYEDIDMIKMTLHKALHTLSIDCCNDTSISIVGKRILNSTRCQNVFLNDIEEESYLFSEQFENFVKFPSFLQEPVRSYVAVGSAIMAILSLAYQSDVNPKNAVKLALVGASLCATQPPVDFFTSNDLIDNITKLSFKL